MRHTTHILAALLATTSVMSSANAYIFEYCEQSALLTEPKMIADLNPGSADAATIALGKTNRRGHMFDFKGSLYFQADNGIRGSELWRSTNGGAPVTVADIAPGPAGSSPHSFVRHPFLNRFYFAATTPATGEELFTYDGTSVSLAKDITPGSAGGAISGLTFYNGEYYFVRGGKLWRFDGSNATQINARSGGVPVFSGSWQTEVLTIFNGKLYFFSQLPDPNIPSLFQTYLRSFDGATISSVKQLTLVQSQPWITGNFDMGVYNGALYFGAIFHAGDGSGQGHAFGSDELWKYTGVGSPIQILKNFTDEGEVLQYSTPDSQPQGFTVFDGSLFFRQNENLWRYDGTNAYNITETSNSTPHTLGSISDYDIQDKESLFFSGFNNFPSHAEPYIHDGGNTQILADINSGTQFTVQSGSQPTRGEQADQSYYFYADDGTHGREMWSFGLSNLKLIKCHVVAAPIWKEWLQWGIDRVTLDVETYLIEPGVAAQRTFSGSVEFAKDKTIDLQAYSFSEPRGVPAGYGVYSVIKDPATNEFVEYGLRVVGAPSDADRDAILRETEILEDSIFGQRR